GTPSPHLAAIQITTDNAVFGGLGGASVASECISWGKEAADGANVMLFADVTLALPLLCQGLLERYGPSHTRRARAAIQTDLAAIFTGGRGPPRLCRDGPSVGGLGAMSGPPTLTSAEAERQR